MNRWNRKGKDAQDEKMTDNNTGMFENDFNMAKGNTDSNMNVNSNNLTFTNMPEAWATLVNLNQLSGNQAMFQEYTNSTNSLASLLRTLSVQTHSNQFQRLPADWAQQAQLNSPTQTNQPNTSFQHLANTALGRNQSSPFPGDKRSSEVAALPEQQYHQNKHQRMEDHAMKPMAHLEPKPGSQEQHLNVLADVKLEESSMSQQELRDASNKTSSKRSTASASTRWNSWSHEEEVFLVVAVLDRFFRRGSLASAGRGSASQGGGDCWGEIQQLYERICKVWASQAENRIKPPLISRSASALCRHFKIMKVRAVEGDKNGSKAGNFRKYLREWDTIYNVGGKLIPDEY